MSLGNLVATPEYVERAIASLAFNEQEGEEVYIARLKALEYVRDYQRPYMGIAADYLEKRRQELR